MSKKGPYDDAHGLRNLKKYNGRIISYSLQHNVAKDIKNKTKNPDWKLKLDDMDKGLKWFESGLSLEDASENDRNNEGFIAGFKKGQRIQFVNQQLYDLGKEYFEKGILLENISEKYRNNEYFMNGYSVNISKKDR